MKLKQKWLIVCLVSSLIAAPNATVIRVAIENADMWYWTMVRFLVIGLVVLPLMYRERHQLKHAKSRRAVLLASLLLAAGVVFYTYAIEMSQASYVSIVTLVNPILVVFFSAVFLREKVGMRAIAGVTLAMIGAMTLVVLPIALQQKGVAFYPLATVLALANSVSFAGALLFMKVAHERGVGLPMILGCSAWMTALVAAVGFVLAGDMSRTESGVGFWVSIAFTAIVVGLINRAITVRSLEVIGAALTSAIGYLQAFVAILIPVIVLGEKLSVEMVVGGILILIGVYIVEHHKSLHGKHHLIMHH